MMQSLSHKKGKVRRIFLIALLLVSVLLSFIGNGSSVSLRDSFAKKPLIVFLITEDTLNYEAHLTIPLFAEKIKKEYGYEVKVLLGSGPHGAYRFPDIHKIDDAALLVVFSRRIAIPHDQMQVIKNYLNKGKPIIGIRTANHAFTNRTKIEPGFEDWPAFVSEILGCENRGYGPVEPGIEVSISPDAANHPILKGVQPKQWHSDGNIYKVAPLLDKDAKVLLTGTVQSITEPVAWIRKAGKSNVFYTSLGYPTDFESASFLTLLTNAIQWSLDQRAQF